MRSNNKCYYNHGICKVRSSRELFKLHRWREEKIIKIKCKDAQLCAWQVQEGQAYGKRNREDFREAEVSRGGGVGTNWEGQCVPGSEAMEIKEEQEPHVPSLLPGFKD